MLKKLLAVLLIIMIFMVTAVFFLMSKSFNSTELLVAWGRQGEVNDRKCILQVINPKNQELSPVYANDQSCNYQVANIRGEPRLVWEQKEPRAIVIYAITSDGRLTTEKILPLEKLAAPSGSLNIQFGDDGAIYFAGILHDTDGQVQDRMQLLRMDPQTEEIVTLSAHEEGMVDFPLISPDGAHLIYSVFNGLKTWSDCRSHCEPYYYLLDIETNSVLNLSSLVNHLGADPLFSHCHIKWSPNGQFIAFNLGCESESPQYIVIFDVDNNQVLTVIKPIEDITASGVGVIGWLSNDELVYGQNVSKEGYNFYPYRYFIYSLTADKYNELTNIPLTTGEGTGLIIRDVNWTSDGEYLTAVIAGWTEASAPLLVMGINSEEPQVSYIVPDTLNERPLWSPSGNWIAYSSASNWEEFFEDGSAIKITNPKGDIFIDTDVSNIMSALGFAWLQP